MLSDNVQQVVENHTKSTEATVACTATLFCTSHTGADVEGAESLDGQSSLTFSACSTVETPASQRAEEAENSPPAAGFSHASKTTELPRDVQPHFIQSDSPTAPETRIASIAAAPSTNIKERASHRKKRIVRIRRHIARDLPTVDAVLHDRRDSEKLEDERVPLRQIRIESPPRTDDEPTGRTSASPHRLEHRVNGEEEAGGHNSNTSTDDVAIQFHAVQRSTLVRYPTGVEPRMWAPDESLVQHLQDLIRTAEDQEVELVDDVDRDAARLRLQKRKSLYEWYIARMRGRAGGGKFPLISSDDGDDLLTARVIRRTKVEPRLRTTDPALDKTETAHSTTTTTLVRKVRLELPRPEPSHSRDNSDIEEQSSAFPARYDVAEGSSEGSSHTLPDTHNTPSAYISSSYNRSPRPNTSTDYDNNHDFNHVRADFESGQASGGGIQSSDSDFSLSSDSKFNLDLDIGLEPEDLDLYDIDLELEYDEAFDRIVKESVLRINLGCERETGHNEHAKGDKDENNKKYLEVDSSAKRNEDEDKDREEDRGPSSSQDELELDTFRPVS